MTNQPRITAVVGGYDLHGKTSSARVRVGRNPDGAYYALRIDDKNGMLGTWRFADLNDALFEAVTWFEHQNVNRVDTTPATAFVD